MPLGLWSLLLLNLTTMIDVLIPTYNRGTDVVANLHALQEQIAAHDLWQKVQIIISDNASPDETEALVADFCQKKPAALQVSYYRNATNIGLEPNAVAVLEKAISPFVLFLGDDDFLADGYLVYCLEKIEQYKDLGCIIPGLLSVFQDGSIKDGRKTAPEAVLPAGYNAVWQWSHFGHQMSGLLCRRAGLLEDYLAQADYRNPYLFLYFTANRLWHYRGIYNPTYKTRVNAFNIKDWGYNEVGLLDEVYLCYFALQNDMEAAQVRDLILRFTVMHSYRLAFHTKNLRKVYQQYQYLVKITQHLNGAKAGLRKIFIKDYLKALF